MSRYSGTCDLYDHIMMEKMYPLDSTNTNSQLVSDEMECFELFKKRTGGVIYQNAIVKLTKFNIDAEIARVNNEYILSKVAKTIEVRDKRSPNGFREIVTYDYIYYGVTYKTLNAINKCKYVTRIPIYFDTLLDIIPYYPFIISMFSSNKDTETVILTSRSHVSFNIETAIEMGRFPTDRNNIFYYYKSQLQNHYLEVIKKYNIQLKEE